MNINTINKLNNFGFQEWEFFTGAEVSAICDICKRNGANIKRSDRVTDNLIKECIDKAHFTVLLYPTNRGDRAWGKFHLDEFFNPTYEGEKLSLADFTLKITYNGGYDSVF